MRKQKVKLVFTMDSDALLLVNATELSENFREKKLWLIYNPPRTSCAFAFMHLEVLEDVLQFWNHMFSANVWTRKTSEFSPTIPNDMVAFGHYAAVKKKECWGIQDESRCDKMDCKF